MNNVDMKIVLSVMAGIAAFGAVMYVISKLPSGNIVTDTVKKVAEVVEA